MLWKDFPEQVTFKLRNEWWNQTEGSASAKALGYARATCEQRGGLCSWSDGEGRGTGAEQSESGFYSSQFDPLEGFQQVIRSVF